MSVRNVTPWLVLSMLIAALTLVAVNSTSADDAIVKDNVKTQTVALKVPGMF